ncbi:hypothetical protein FA13DRAFT_1719136 [Coprinellus micaceus]|uniref:Uncharacterized protein n=1 Tax=Coprinellus micaceus TaxID=71717 RepID=A0A4Y7SCT6_COPMI|nr:hypothetical protein FA13DRAFT_1719136 [Coprinellus micaceus]
MVKFTQAVLVAALIAGPALALAEEVSSRDVNPAEAETALSAREVAALYERGRRQGGGSRGGRTPGKRRGGRGAKGRRGKKRRGGRGKKELQAAAGEAAGAGAEAAAGAAAETLTARQVLAAVEPEFEEREVAELLERSPIFRKIFRGVKRVGGALLGRDIGDIDDLATRDLVELDVRAPIFGKIFRGAKRVVGGLFGRELQAEDAGGITAREVEELYEREPIFGKIFRGVKRVGGAIFGREIDIHGFAQMAERGFDDLDELSTRQFGAEADAESLSAREVLAAVEPEFEAREVAELLERSPIFRKIFRGVKRVGGALLGRDIEDIEDLSTRDFVELDVRAPIFGKIFRGAKRVVGGLFGRELEGEEFGEITARDIEELYEREPIFRKIFRGIKRVGGGLLGRDIDTQEFAQVAERGFDDFSDEIYARDMNIDELEARDPLFWLAAKALSKVVRRKRSLEDLDDYLEARYFDDGDYLEARNPDEELLETRTRLQGLLGPLRRPFGWRGIKP